MLDSDKRIASEDLGGKRIVLASERFSLKRGVVALE